MLSIANPPIYFLMKKQFSEKNIIQILARTKAKKTLLRSNFVFYKNISKNAKNIHTHFEIDTLCPPRKQWLRLQKSEREKLSPIKLIEVTVFRTIIARYKKPEEQSKEWVQKLSTFIKTIKKEIFIDQDFCFSEPIIIPELKDQKTVSYRPISNFGLKEKVIASLTTKYLSTCFETIWEIPNCSYAFRSSKKIITHHTAVENILKYKRKHANLFAAECDIKKFFDSVNHEKTLAIFEENCRNLLNKGVIIDDIAKRIFISYLNCYSFQKTVIEKKERWFSLLRQTDERAHFEWIDGDLDHRGIVDKNDIGVPQGGALSCFIANLILHSVDIELMETNDPDLFYARYCDDMIIIHPNKEKCSQYLFKYVANLEKINLFSHPITEEKYGKDYWDVKSKATYLWADKKADAVPWLSFVGYHIRYDNVIRVRPKAIKKEKSKQIAIVDEILRSINIKNKKRAEENINIHTLQIIYRARKKLLAMSVGAITSNQLKKGNKFCWVEGFKLLKNETFIFSQIKSLDKSRLQQIQRLKNHLSKLKTPDFKKKEKDVTFDKFDSNQLSYFSQFSKKQNDPNSTKKQKVNFMKADDIPEWHIPVVTERLAAYEPDPALATDLDAAMDDIEAELQ